MENILKRGWDNYWSKPSFWIKVILTGMMAYFVHPFLIVLFGVALIWSL